MPLRNRINLDLKKILNVLKNKHLKLEKKKTNVEKFIGSRLFILEERITQGDSVSVFKYLRRLLTAPILQKAENRGNGFTFHQRRMMQEEHFESRVIKKLK